MLTVPRAIQTVSTGIEKVKPLEDMTFHLVRFAKRWGALLLLWPETRVLARERQTQFVCNVQWFRWGTGALLDGVSPHSPTHPEDNINDTMGRNQCIFFEIFVTFSEILR